jgi:phosphatidylglycerol lysyltransferase
MKGAKWIRAQVGRWRATLTPLLNLLLFAVAIWVVNRVLAEYKYDEIAGALTAVPISAVALALGVTVAAYLALVGYDFLAFRYAGFPLPFRSMLIRSFVAWAVSNTAPASALTAGGLRYRLYARRGLTAADAAVVAAFNIVTYLVGLLGLVGLILLFHPSTGMLAGRWLAISGRALGAVFVLAVAGYLLAARLRREPVRVLRWQLRLPSFELALGQLGVSILDWLLSSGALYVLLAGVGRISYLDFLGAFLLAQMATQVLPLPGGIGVFEAVVLVLRPHGSAAPGLLAGLLLYRVVYYLLPLLAAGVLMVFRGMFGARRQGKPLEALLEGLGDLAPHALAFVTFLAGTLLLLTGAVPTSQRRLAWLADLLPLAAIEVSHFLASVVGAVLLILAWGLERRAHLAYRLAQVLFGVGIVLALLRSLDLPLAVLLGVALVILHAAADEFPETRSLLDEPFSAGWRLAIAMVLGLTLWLGLFVYRHESYSTQLWWQFALAGDAPRFLRVLVGMGIVVLLFALARILGHRGVPAQAAAGVSDARRRGGPDAGSPTG